MIKSLGADAVVDYTREDFSQAGRVYDLVVRQRRQERLFAEPESVEARRDLRPHLDVRRSRLAADRPIKQMWISLTGAARCIGGVSRNPPGDLAFIKQIVEAGALETVIDRRYPLDEIDAAFRYAEAGHKKGHVVVLVQQRCDLQVKRQLLFLAVARDPSADGMRPSVAFLRPDDRPP